MLAKQLFYNSPTIIAIQPFLPRIKKYHSADSIDRFPLSFSNTKVLADDIRFFSKHLVPNQTKHLFSSILQIMSFANPNNAPLQTTRIFQPNLLSHIRQKAYPYDIHINPSYKFQILRSHIIESKKITGIFMHRSLNMPFQCYEILENKDKNVSLKLKEQIGRHDHTQMLSEKKKSYFENQYQLQRYYMDSYENFCKNQTVVREVIEVNAKIQGTLIFQDRKKSKQVSLPLNPNKPVTTHLLQIQKIKIPGRHWTQTTFITDIDFFMEGNPHTL